MKRMLLIIESPSGNNERSESHVAYSSILDKIKTILSSTKYLKQIGTGVVWTPVKNGLHEIAPLLSYAKKEQYPHRVLFYDDEDSEMIDYRPSGS